MFRLARETRVPAIRQRAFNSVVVMVLFVFPSLVRRKRRFPLEIRRHRDPLPLVPRQPEVLVLDSSENLMWLVSSRLALK